MSGYNSLPALLRESPEGIQEAIGVTQFPGEHEWVHIFGGLIFQGGVVSRTGETTISVSFNVAYPKQILGIFVSPAIFQITPTGDLSGFSVPSDGTDTQFYWFAIGV
jgi:hypothetical protein